MKRIKHNIRLVAVLLFAAIGLSSCEGFLEYPHESTRVSQEILIGEYFEQHADTFSVFARLLNETGNMSFLKAYGAYTCFAPTNQAFRKYFTEKGQASESTSNADLESLISSMEMSDLKSLVRFYVIKDDTITSEYFVDGRLGTPTMQGQYLTYGTYFEDGEVVGKINKTATIEQKDISLINGIVHSLKSVLEPDKRTIAQYIDELEGYSIFKEALKTTGLYDSLDRIISPENDTVWYTMFIVSDEVLNADGIYSVADIGTKYEKDDIPADSALYLYMAYHILPDQYQFVTDLVSAKAVNTLAPSEVLTVKASGTSVLINDDTFAGIYEPGFEINRSASDLTVDNGVIHFMDGNFFVKKRYPFAVYWDVTDQPEIKKMPGVFRKAGATIESGQLSGVSWEPTSLTIYYSYGAVNGAYGHVFNDFFDFYLRPAVIQSITFTTPTLVKGTYQMWIGTRTQNSAAGTGRGCKANIYFNGEQTTKIFDNTLCYNSAGGEGHYSDGELNLLDMKIYSYNPGSYYTSDTSLIASKIAEGIANNWVSEAGRYAAQNIGTVEVTTTGPQELKFVAISGGSYAEVRFDQIHFIPVDEEQNWPRINRLDGTEVYREDLEAGILPKP